MFTRPLLRSLPKFDMARQQSKLLFMKSSIIGKQGMMKMLIWVLYWNWWGKIKLQVYSRLIFPWHIIEWPVELYLSVAEKLLYYLIWSRLAASTQSPGSWNLSPLCLTSFPLPHISPSSLFWTFGFPRGPNCCRWIAELCYIWFQIL